MKDKRDTIWLDHFYIAGKLEGMADGIECGVTPEMAIKNLRRLSRVIIEKARRQSLNNGDRDEG